MCDKNSNLNKAILSTVKEFADSNTKFSVHDVTRALRDKTNDGTINIPELKISNSKYSHNIPHSSVKDAFIELLNDDVFKDLNIEIGRQYNGMYFEYTATISSTNSSTSALNSVVNSIVNSSHQTAVNPPISKPLDIGKPDEKTVTNRINRYLANTSYITPTLKQIQSAIKCKGWTCDELLVLIDSKMNNKINRSTSNVSDYLISK